MSTPGLISTSEGGTVTPFPSTFTNETDNFTITETSTSMVTGDHEEEIAANDIISRANYVYTFLAVLGFIAGCFLLYSFIQGYRTKKRLAWLDCLLWVFCGLQLLLLLLSLHSVAYRPEYMRATGLGCAALSFIINAASLCSLSLLVLMAYFLTLDQPSYNLLRKPGVCVGLVILTSVLISLLLAGLRGPKEGLQEESRCLMDPVSDGVSYAAARLWLVFLIPYILQLGLLIVGCVRQWKLKGRFLSGSEEGPVFLMVTIAMFLCQLFYSVVLMRAAQLEGAELRHHERALQSVAEFVLFSGSSLSLLIMLFMHRPCRESLHGAFRQLKDCCRSSGRTPPTRNIIAPQIEITDTLQDIEP